MGFVLLILVIVFVLGPVAKAYAERLSRELPADAGADRLELARIRDEVERLAVEVARLQDEQSFMVKLLNEGERKRLGEGPQTLE